MTLPGPCFTKWIYSWGVLTASADVLTKSIFANWSTLIGRWILSARQPTPWIRFRNIFTWWNRAQAVGGIFLPLPLLFFQNCSGLRKDSDVKFCIASNEYLAHMCAKFCVYPRSGQGTVASQSSDVSRIFAWKTVLYKAYYISGSIKARKTQ